MKALFKITSFAGLAVMLVSAVLVFGGMIDRHTYYNLAFLGTVLWFATVPFWMKRRLHHSE